MQKYQAKQRSNNCPTTLPTSNAPSPNCPTTLLFSSNFPNREAITDNSTGFCPRPLLLALLLLLLLIPLTSATGADDLIVDISPYNAIHPDYEFYIIMTITNTGSETILVEIYGDSGNMNFTQDAIFNISKRSERRIGFTIPALEEIGDYNISWIISGDGEVSATKQTKIFSTRMSEVLGDVIEYYDEQLQLLPESKDNIYIEDAKKHLDSAEQLFARQSYFESIKYIDFTRQSLSYAILGETEQQEQELKQQKNILTLNIKNTLNNIKIKVPENFIQVSILILGLIGFLTLIFFASKYLLKKIKRSEQPTKTVLATPQLTTPLTKKLKTTHVGKIEELKHKISLISDQKKKEDLTSDLKNCEEKYQIGLHLLGDAYYKRIKKKLGEKEIEKEDPK